MLDMPPCDYYWNFEEGECCVDALIDQDCDGDRWEWRITEHEIAVLQRL